MFVLTLGAFHNVSSVTVSIRFVGRSEILLEVG